MISLRCSVVDAQDPRCVVDVDVVGPTGSTLAQASPALLSAVAAPATAVLHVGGRPLPAQAPLGQPPLVDGALLVAMPAACPAGAGTAALLELHIVGGPDAGRVVPLRPGEWTIGRGGTAVCLNDPDLSRRHLAVEVRAQALTVRDLDSTNGTQLDGEDLQGESRPLRPGQRLTAGATSLTVRTPTGRMAALRTSGAGQLELTRSPADRPASPTVEIRRRPRPQPRPAAPLPWPMLTLPLLAGVVIAWLMKQPSYLLIGLMSPLMLAGSAITDRVGRRREERAELQLWQAAEQAADRLLQDALAEELRISRRAAGDPAQTLATVRRRTSGLWARGRRDPDLLAVAVGSGPVPSSVRVCGVDDAPVPLLSAAPVTARLGEIRHLAVIGDAARVAALGRWIVLQLAVRSSPQAVQLLVLAGTSSSRADEWTWRRWLPHTVTAGAADLERLVRARHDTAQASASTQASASSAAPLVVLVDGRGGWTQDLALATVLQDGPTVGVHLIWLGQDRGDLPEQCTTWVHLPPQGAATWHRDGQQDAEILADGVCGGWAEEVARALAPLRDVTPDPDRGPSAPRSVGLAELLDLDPSDPAALAAKWTSLGRSTSVRLGCDGEGPVTFDLATDGPHALVAGTTGAGKSELLQTLVTSLALANRPDEMTFVLVDYKGGAAFRGCADLPHVIGMVTDLDDELAQRALASLQAELTRRERLLQDAGAADLPGYQRWRDQGGTRARLARLVLVIDEFRVLASELPAFVEGLVRLAAVGRSLGVHLVLATQRPAGIVSADIKSNVNLRIALRVRDRVDSDDVVDAPDAAHLPGDIPGRALARTGAGPLVGFQVALADGVPRPVAPAGVSVTVAGPADPPPRPEHTGAGDLRTIVRSARMAAAQLGIEPPKSPWLPPLPAMAKLEDLELQWERQAALDPAAGAGVAVLGIIDQPARGRQELLTWHPVHAAHLAVSGASRTGRTTALLSLAWSLARRWAPHELHLHAVDATSAGLAVLAGLPHTGTVVTQDQPHLLTRLITRLSDEVRRRRAGGTSAPALVLLVDGWDAMVQALERVDHGRPVEDLLALLRDGESAGLRAVLTGGRAVLTSRLATLVSERLVLRCSDPTDLMLAGLPISVARTPNGQAPPGRGHHVPSGDPVQLAWPGEPEQLQALARGLDSGVPRPPDQLVLKDLPASIGARALDPAPTGTAQVSDFTRTVALGVGGDGATTVGLDLVSDPLVAVCGPTGSGRSTTLATLADCLLSRGHPVAVLCPRPSTITEGEWAIWPCDDPEALSRHLDREPATTVVVDDVDLLLGTAMEDLLTGLARRRGPTSLVVAGMTRSLSSSYRGLAEVIRATRTGVVLQPQGPEDGELLGVRATQPSAQLPGRGLLVVRGQAVAVQVATPPDPPAGSVRS